MTETQRPFTAASFNSYLNEEKLMASYCPDSDTLYLPPRAICPKTHSTNMEWRELNGTGKLVAFTSVYVGLSRMGEQGYNRDNPYCTGIVELDEGVRISAQIIGVDATHPETIEIGTPLQVEYLEHQDGNALGFRPVD